MLAEGEGWPHHHVMSFVLLGGWISSWEKLKLSRLGESIELWSDQFSIPTKRCRAWCQVVLGSLGVWQLQPDQRTHQTKMILVMKENLVLIRPHWERDCSLLLDRGPGKVMGSSSLEMFKDRLDKAQSYSVWIQCGPWFEQEVGVEAKVSSEQRCFVIPNIEMLF